MPVTLPARSIGATLFVCSDPEAAWIASCQQATTSFSTTVSSLAAAGTAASAAVTGLAGAISSVITPAVSSGTAGQAWEDIRRFLAEHREETEAAQLRRQVADARAHVLLLSLLTAEQAETYVRAGWFELRGSAGGWWRIRRDGQAGNVDELSGPGGDRIATWCCHPPGGLPDADAHAAQLLQLQANEPGFRAAGNRRPRPRLPAARPLVIV